MLNSNYPSLVAKSPPPDYGGGKAPARAFSNRNYPELQNWHTDKHMTALSISDSAFLNTTGSEVEKGQQFQKVSLFDKTYVIAAATLPVADPLQLQLQLIGDKIRRIQILLQLTVVLVLVVVLFVVLVN